MIVVNKEQLNEVSFTLNGPLVQEGGSVSGYLMVEWKADDTDETIYMLPISTYYVSWRQVKISFAEGTHDPMIGYINLTGTKRHWTYNVWNCPDPVPTEPITSVPTGSTLLETGKVWVEGTDNSPINEIYK